MQALLSFRRDEFTFPFVVKSLVQAIDDPKDRVKLAAVEAMAVASSMVGSQMGPLLNAVGAPESTRSLLNERFASKALPSLNADDLVEHQVSFTNRLSALPVTAPDSFCITLHARIAQKTLRSLHRVDLVKHQVACTQWRCKLLGCNQKAIGIWVLHAEVDAGRQSEGMVVTERL